MREAFLRWQLLLSAELPSRRLEALAAQIGRFGDVGALEWANAVSTSPDERERLRRGSLQAATAAYETGVRALSRADLPERYHHCPGQPPALFVWGDPECLRRPTIGIVGTRAAGVYGKACAQKFAEALAKAGVTIVSGGALGIDAAAHQGALEAGGQTAAVLGTGITQVYPASHGGLFRRIRAGGCLLSPFGIGSKTRPDRFLARNQVIAALSDALLVIEAPEASGSLNTASAAAEFNRSVYVVPAAISQTSFRGSHALIRSGATLVDHPDQILDELGVLALQPPDERPEPDLSDEQRAILEVLGPEPLNAEKIASLAGLEPVMVMTELTMLELEGKVVRASGGYAAAP